jgi:Phage integrase, N-terminal SAM-like domain
MPGNCPACCPGFTVVATPDGQVPYALVGPDSVPVAPVQDYLAELQSADCSPLTLKSYAFDLLDWFRFLAAAGIGWQDATRAHVRDGVLSYAPGLEQRLEVASRSGEKGVDDLALGSRSASGTVVSLWTRRRARLASCRAASGERSTIGSGT